MSRYLDYIDQPIHLDEGQIVPGRPKWRGPIACVGPEQRFVSYLKPENYSGMSTVCLGGRIAAGQIWPNMLSTAFMIFVPGFMYLNYVLPRFLFPEVHNAHLVHPHHSGNATHAIVQ